MSRLYNTSGFDTHREELHPTTALPLPLDSYPRRHLRTYGGERTLWPGPRLLERTAYTNLLSRSEEFDHADWTKTALTVTPNSVRDPRDGQLVADTLLETVTNAEHKCARANTFTAGNHTLSIFAKALGRDWLHLLANDGTTNFDAWFNLATGFCEIRGSLVIGPALRNGSFETAGGGGADVFANWSESMSGVTLSQDVSAQAGTYACKTANATGVIVAGTLTQSGILTIARTYRLTFWAKSNGVGNPMVQGVVSGGLNLTSRPLAAVTSYQQFTEDFVATGTAFQFQITTPASGGEVFLDNVELRELPATGTAVMVTMPDWDGFYRCGVSFLAAAGVGSVTVGLSDDGTNTTYAGDTTKGMAMWGIELKYGTEPGPYVSTTSTSRAISAPDLDPDDIFAYQVGETGPVPTLADLVRYTRTFSRIPYTQYTPIAKLFGRPVMHDLKSGSYYAVSHDGGASSSLYATRQTSGAPGGITANTKAVGGTVAGTGTVSGTGVIAAEKQALTPDGLPSTTITIYNDAGSSQTFALNATRTTINSALSALTITAQVLIGANTLTIKTLAGSTKFLKEAVSTDASVTISMLDQGFTAQRNQSTAYDEREDTRAIVDTRSITDTHSLTETYSNPDSVRSIPCTTHGGVVGDLVAIWNGDKLISTSRVVIVGSANVFSVPIEDVPGKDAAITHIQFAKNASARYVNGGIVAPGRKVSRFYLPGVTPGITTVEDITASLSAPAIDPAGWMAAIIAGSTYVVESVADLATFEGPIVTSETVELKLANCLVTMPVAA